MSWPSNDSLRAQLTLNGYTGDINDAFVAYLRALYSISDRSYNDLLYYHLGQLGYTGTLNDRIRRWDGTIFSPLSLFAAGEQGFWYDPSDFSTLFQDSAGTIPVTATTQPVGRILDKSGRGNHATQVTSTARPTLQQDANGKYYLSFDGVDDFLVTGNINFTATSRMTSWAGIYSASTSLGLVGELSANTSLNNGTFALGLVNNPTAGRLSFQGRASNVDSIASSASTYNLVKLVITLSVDLTQALATSKLVAQINNTSGLTASLVDNADTSTAFGTYPFYIGARGGTTLPFNGRVYGMIVRGASSTAQQILSGNTFIDSRIGAY